MDDDLLSIVERPEVFVATHAAGVVVAVLIAVEVVPVTHDQLTVWLLGTFPLVADDDFVDIAAHWACLQMKIPSSEENGIDYSFDGGWVKAFVEA